MNIPQDLDQTSPVGAKPHICVACFAALCVPTFNVVSGHLIVSAGLPQKVQFHSVIRPMFLPLLFFSASPPERRMRQKKTQKTDRPFLTTKLMWLMDPF